jgi:hypothetical protein
MVQMGRSGDGHGVGLEIEQRVKMLDRGTAEHPVHEVALLWIGIGDAGDVHVRQACKYAGVVRAHDASANDADPQRLPRAVLHCPHHV